MSTKKVSELAVDDVVVSMGEKVFNAPLTVVRRNDHMVYLNNGGFWPIVMLGPAECGVR